MNVIEKKGLGRSAAVLGILILVFIIIICTNFGATDISWSQTAKIIFSRLPIIGKYISLKGISDSSQIIILNLRLPRIILAALVGAGLSVVGTSFQSIFKNPMADPYVLGISSGAALGATITIILGLDANLFGMSLMTGNAFLGAILTTLLVYNIARVGNKVPTITLLLSGIAISYLLSAIISILMIFHRDSIERIVMWTMGNLSAASWNQVGILTLIIIPCTLGICFFSRELNMMLLGEESARNLGVEVDRVKKIILFISTLMVAGIVSFSGIIGFVGLIVPHMIRILFGSDHRRVIPLSAILGAIFLILCDTVARSIAPPAEIPVGIITSMLGVPFFLYLLYKSKKKVL